ncbi:hypothetical protein CASFOL_000237 [Castilleja foliolosa]|uniref:Exostosin GT47 domain-containing protein n=1 Tax=Castilleja foliolosa TaxID=1961234 RepID=A0ABD3ERI3_9LAMI
MASIIICRFPSPLVLLYMIMTCFLLCILLYNCFNTKFHFYPFSSSFPTHMIKQNLGIEEGLSRARAAIIKAGERRSFIPRGSIYRNPYAFHQSYLEMEKRFKVWTYQEGEVPLFHLGQMHDIYSIEGHFVDEMESLDNPFAAGRANEAHAFFLPVQVAQIVRYLYEYEPRLDYDRLRLQNVVSDYITILANKYPYWNRSAGADHFYVACHDWGPDVSGSNPKLFKNLIRVLCNANVSEGFKPSRDASIPDIKVFSRHGLGPPAGLSESPENRTILAFFAGGPHGHVREKLFKHWKDKDEEFQVHEYLPENADYFELMSRSKYCLCPSGYEVASPRLVESIHAGCVPVIISDGYSLPFEDVLDWSRFSVDIPVARIPEIKKILEGIPRGEYLKKQKRVLKVKKHFVLHRPAQRFDMLNMVLHSVWLRRLNVRLF